MAIRIALGSTVDHTEVRDIGSWLVRTRVLSPVWTPQYPHQPSLLFATNSRTATMCMYGTASCHEAVIKNGQRSGVSGKQVAHHSSNPSSTAGARSPSFGARASCFLYNPAKNSLELASSRLLSSRTRKKRGNLKLSPLSSLTSPIAAV